MGFSSAEELARLLESVITRLDAAEMHAAANVLRRVRSTAYTTSSEWLAELGRAIRQVQHGSPVDPAVAADVDRIMQQVRRVWPKL